jgi:hypothetical protein
LQPSTTSTAKDEHARKEPAATDAHRAFSPSPIEVEDTVSLPLNQGGFLRQPVVPIGIPPTMEAPNAAAPKGPCASHRRTNAITCRRPEALHRETPPPPMKNHAASPPRGLLDLSANDQTSACTKEVGDSTPPYQPPQGPPTAGLNNHQHRDGEPEAKPQIWLAVDIGPT